MASSLKGEADLPEPPDCVLRVPAKQAKEELQKLIDEAIQLGRAPWSPTPDDSEKIFRFAQLQSWKLRAVQVLRRIFVSADAARQFQARVQDENRGNHVLCLTEGYGYGNGLLSGYLHGADSFPVETIPPNATPTKASAAGKSLDAVLRRVNDHPARWIIVTCLTLIVGSVSGAYGVISAFGFEIRLPTHQNNREVSNQGAGRSKELAAMTNRLGHLASEVNELRDRTYSFVETPNSQRQAEWASWRKSVQSWYGACVAALEALGARAAEFLGAFKELFDGTNANDFVLNAEMYPPKESSEVDRKRYLWPVMKDSQRLLIQAALVP